MSESASHPFLDPSFLIPWSALTPEYIEPDIRLALAEAQAAINTIATTPLGEVTYANTFAALEAASGALNEAWGKVTHLQSVNDGPELRTAHNNMLGEVSGYYAKIPLNPDLFARLKTFAESPAGQVVAGIERRLMDETLADFRESGADLPPDKRARLEVIESELAEVTQKYGENVLDATNAWELLIDDESRLAGLPKRAKMAAMRDAAKKGHGTEDKPVWRFTLQYPSLAPVMTYAEDESLRETVWRASTAVGHDEPHNNVPLIREILRLRAEKAAVLGKPHFADVVLERRMAKNAERALAFELDLKSRTQAAFLAECADLEAFKAARTEQPIGPLKAWEVSFWAEKLRRDRYAFDEEALRPYFPMDRVIFGLYELVGKVFGLQVEPLAPGTADVWHEEVLVYALKATDGRHLGTFYADWHPRESKRGGAWMNYFKTGLPPVDGGPRGPHLGLICGNLTPPLDGKPALITHREVETVFHEFGHLLHHLLGEVPIKSLNGVNVPWDFVELPSQIMENWCWERESLDLFARHHETGEAIPEELFNKMIAAKNFRSACGVMRQLQLGLVDLLMHTETARFVDGNLEAAAEEAIADTQIPTVPPARTNIVRFGHLFSDPVGYAAGYYSYKWAEVLDADAFTRFQKEGIFNAETGADFVKWVLSRGNSADPAELFRGFMGRDPKLSALLERCGLGGAA